MEEICHCEHSLSKLASLQAKIWGLTRIDKCLLVPVPLLHLREPPFLFLLGNDDRPEVVLLFLFLFLPYGGEAEPFDVDEVDLFELRQGAFYLFPIVSSVLGLLHPHTGKSERAGARGMEERHTSRPPLLEQLLRTEKVRDGCVQLGREGALPELHPIRDVFDREMPRERPCRCEDHLLEDGSYHLEAVAMCRLWLLRVRVFSWRQVVRLLGWETWEGYGA